MLRQLKIPKQRRNLNILTVIHILNLHQKFSTTMCFKYFDIKLQKKELSVIEFNLKAR